MEQEELIEGRQYYVEIINKGDKGDAVAKVNGCVVFIKEDLSIGDKVNIEITRVMPKYAFANVIDDEK